MEEVVPTTSDPRLTETEAILDALPHPTFAISSDLNVIRMNRASLLRSGAGKYAEVIGQKCHSLLHNRSVQCPFCPMLDELKPRTDESSPNPLQKIIQEKDAEKDEKIYRVSFIHIGQKRINLVEMIEDITQERERQEEAMRRENLAALGTMISGIAHELNNPVTGIGLTLQNLEANIDQMQTDEIKKRIGILKKDMHRASRIIADILSFSRPGELKLTRSDIMLNIRRSLETVKRLYPVLSRRVQWIVEGEENVIFEFHQEKIERLFINLFKNSIEALDYQEGYIRISVKRLKRYVNITVEDNAGGISSEELQRIFNPFFSREKNKKGTGLGLTIVHSIVKEHRGRIRARSHSGKTFFYISLPHQNNG